jgi:hypothetical protein
MNTQPPSSTPHDSHKAGSDMTAQSSPHVADSAATTPIEIGTEPIASQNIPTSTGTVEGTVARPEIPADIHNQAAQSKAPRANFASVGLVHILEPKPLVTESPVVGERAVHHLEAGSNRPKPPEQEHPTPQQDAAGLVLARIYPNGNVPPKHTGTMLYDKFKREWDRDPGVLKMKRPSRSTVLRQLGKKKH